MLSELHTEWRWRRTGRRNLTTINSLDVAPAVEAKDGDQQAAYQALDSNQRSKVHTPGVLQGKDAANYG